MSVDFGLAEYADNLEGKTGECLLRFDDTNPCNDYEKYMNNIKENINWLGYTPSRITFTSDYFDILYELAIKLLKNGDGYICELSADEIKNHRALNIPSPHRDRSIESNLALFTEMRDGKHKAGKYVMRMKGDLENPNPCMWDLVFYRTIDKHHPRTGDKWCIYPTYDFSHCIVDSLEGITHSLCSKEFESRRESYFWLLDVLGLRKPLVYEFARFDVNGYNLSKRFIRELVEKGTVDSWGSPSLLTIDGLRNKGYTSSSIIKFCNLSGVTKADSSLSIDKLEYIVSKELDPTVERRVAITNPLEVEIVNFDKFSDEEKSSKFYNYPSYMDKILKGDVEGLDPIYQAYRNIDLTNIIYINRSDFREVDHKKYYGFAPGKTARLRYNGYFKCINYDKNDDIVTKLYLEKIIPENPKQIKGVLLWVNYSAKAGNLYSRYVDETKLNPYIVDKIECLVEESVDELKSGTRIQFEKIGYFIKKNTPNLELECVCSLRSLFK
jgi:glutaminyl-tRNA synthetase